MATQRFGTAPHYAVKCGSDGYYAVAPDGSHRGPFDSVEDAMQGAVDAAAASVRATGTQALIFGLPDEA